MTESNQDRVPPSNSFGGAHADADVRPARIVLGPDVLAASFFDPACKAVLDHWRNGDVRLVVTRELLMAYLSTLRGLGLSDALLRRWATWFTARDAAEVDMSGKDSGGSVPALLAQAAARGARYVVVNRPAWSEALPAEIVAINATDSIRELAKN